MKGYRLILIPDNDMMKKRLARSSEFYCKKTENSHEIQS
jgi:hypothetical protein